MELDDRTLFFDFRAKPAVGENLFSSGGTLTDTPRSEKFSKNFAVRNICVYLFNK